MLTRHLYWPFICSVYSYLISLSLASLYVTCLLPFKADGKGYKWGLGVEPYQTTAKKHGPRLIYVPFATIGIKGTINIFEIIYVKIDIKFIYKILPGPDIDVIRAL